MCYFYYNDYEHKNGHSSIDSHAVPSEWKNVTDKEYYEDLEIELATFDIITQRDLYKTYTKIRRVISLGGAECVENDICSGTVMAQFLTLLTFVINLIK